MDQVSHWAALTKAGGSRGADRDKMLDPLQRPGWQELAGVRLGPQQACGSHTVEVTVPTGDACDTLLLPQRVLARSAVAYLVIPPGALLLCTPVNAPGEDIHPQLRLPLDSQSHQSCPWSRKQCSEEMGVGGYPKCKTCSQKKKTSYKL